VIARAAVLAYKGKSPSPAEVGRDLKVRYVVDGSIRRAPERLRVSVSLTDTTRSAVLWSEKFDVEPKDIFSVQDQITHRISGALAVRVTSLELMKAAAKPSNDVEAYDLVLRGRDLLGRHTRSDNLEARRLFERAIEIDLTYAPAYVGLGRVNRFAAVSGWTQEPIETLKRAASLARKAIELDDLNAGAHALLGQVLVQFGEYDGALDALKRAIDINASDPEVYRGLAAVLLWRGDTQGAIAAGEVLGRFQPNLSPPDVFHLAMAYVLADRGADAIRILRQSLDRNSADPQTNILLAAAYAEAGNQSEAKRQSESIRKRFPLFSRESFGSLLREVSQRERLSAMLEKAGL
jgi:adenylate cyclase